jgi:hypothetical protein
MSNPVSKKNKIYKHGMCNKLKGQCMSKKNRKQSPVVVDEVQIH